MGDRAEKCQLRRSPPGSFKGRKNKGMIKAACTAHVFLCVVAKPLVVYNESFLIKPELFAPTSSRCSTAILGGRLGML